MILYHDLIRLFFDLILSRIPLLSLNYLNLLADASELIGQNHPFLLIIVLLIYEFHHLVEIRVLMQLAEVLHGFFSQGVHVLHDLERVLKSLVVEILGSTAQLLSLLADNTRTPLRSLFGVSIDLVKID